MILFNWDIHKNKTNILKHGVDFIESQTTFEDEDALLIYDDEHSDDEDRYVLIGISSKGNVLVTCHCYREDEQVIRIISSRKANTKEIKTYLGAKL